MTEAAALSSWEVRRARFRRALQHLLPPGRAWTRDRDAVLTDLLDRLSWEFGRVDERANRFLRELDPRLARETLADWLRVWGLASAEATDEGRRAALLARLSETASQSRRFYEAIAAQLGYAIEIVEHHDPFVAGSPVGHALEQDAWFYVWDVYTASGDNDELLEALFRKYQQQHTVLRFFFEE